jgi:hypothetical protein
MEQHLYTSVLAGVDDDAFETWIKAEVEDPALEAIDKVRRGRQMSPRDYHRLAYYFAATDLRTPAGYLAHTAFVDRSLPQVLDDVLARLSEHLESDASTGGGLVETAPSVPMAEAPLSRITLTPNAERDLALLRVDVINGREYWLRSIRGLLHTAAHVLKQHRWVIRTPADGAEWPTSDRPALRVNWYDDGHYDFEGGWGSHGTDLVLPLSPQHLLHARVGFPDRQHGEAHPEVTRRLRRVIVDGALRSVIARTAVDDIPQMRERRVDRTLWTAERQEWEEFHRTQSAAEVGFSEAPIESAASPSAADEDNQTRSLEQVATDRSELGGMPG